MAQHTLISTRRHVPAPTLHVYQQEWERLRSLATGAGARAWRFCAASDPLHFIEFLEFASGSDPRGTAEIREAAEALDAIAPGTAETWLDATLSSESDA